MANTDMIKIKPNEFKQLAQLIESRFGIHLKEEKATLITGRLHKVLAELDLDNFTDYYNYLIADKSGTALTTLVDKITTNHTFFMREAEHFDYFYHEVLPRLKHEIHDRDLRVWCAASATGEEPYTLAMLINDFFEGEIVPWETTLLATDISKQALKTAMTGIYMAEQVQPLPQHWKTKYFKKISDDRYEVVDSIKRKVLFREFNLMEDLYPFKKKLHVIFCRNVMIYFDNSTKEKVMHKMYNALVEGGVYFIGHSESINRNNVPFHYVKPAVYVKASTKGGKR